MPKRSVWLAAGVAVGAGSSLWAERRLRRAAAEAAARLQPDALVAEVGRATRDAAEDAGERVRDAVAAGRDAMRLREQELWAELDARGVTAGPPHLDVEPEPGPAVAWPSGRRSRRPLHQARRRTA